MEMLPRTPLPVAIEFPNVPDCDELKRAAIKWLQRHDCAPRAEDLWPRVEIVCTGAGLEAVAGHPRAEYVYLDRRWYAVLNAHAFGVNPWAQTVMDPMRTDVAEPWPLLPPDVAPTECTDCGLPPEYANCTFMPLDDAHAARRRGRGLLRGLGYLVAAWCFVIALIVFFKVGLSKPAAPTTVALNHQE